MSDAARSLESMGQVDWYNQWLIGRVEKFIKGDILEVGCGIGNFTKKLINFGSVTTFDVEDQYIKEVKRQLNKFVNVGFGDIEKGDYFFNDKKFDSIICFSILEHVRNDKKALDNLYGLLKDKGFLILVLPAHPLLFGEIDKSIGHFRRYDEKKLIEMIKSKRFKIVKSYKFNFLGAIGWWVAGKILKNKAVESDKVKIFNILGPTFMFIETFIHPPFGLSILTIAQK